MQPSVPRPPPAQSNIHILECMLTCVRRPTTNTASVQEVRAACAWMVGHPSHLQLQIKKRVFSSEGKNAINSPEMDPPRNAARETSPLLLVVRLSGGGG